MKRRASATAKGASSTLVIENVAQYIDEVRKRRENWLPSEEIVGPWFRGHSNSEWPLLPTLYRQFGSDRYVEDEIREEFAQRGPAFCQTVPSNDWEWYFLMQHHGAPTRLLDWTDGALIGLYFAVRESRGFADAAVWMLDPFWLNKRNFGKDEIFSPSASGTLAVDRKKLKPWLPARFAKRSRLPNEPVAVFPGHIARRISTQRSCFTVHGRSLTALDELALLPKGRLVKFTIPSFRTAEIRRELETCGIDEATVFPDLEGLCRTLGMRWNHEETHLPHDGSFTRLKPSKIGGVGVFAIRRISRGTRLFAGDSADMVWIEASSLGRLPKEVRRLYEDFAVLKNGRYGCPPTFNRLTIAWYLNESKEPNVRCDENYDFIAARDISAGEELTTDYSTYSEAPARRTKESSAKSK